MTSAQKCRKNGWNVGTLLVGNEGYGDTVIRITAIGRNNILAECVSHDEKSECGNESWWTLRHRKWRRLAESRKKKVRGGR